MDCLVLPVSILRRRGGGCSRLRYQPLTEEAGFVEGSVTVVVGKEKREFLVDPLVLEENPFRVLIDSVLKKADDQNTNMKMKTKERRVILVDVDAILFEHMLWLMHNDCSSLFQLNVTEIIDFYAQDF
ncbi:Auxin responsive SAUR protein [Melia azedarach]|uniref:Auxin responsive SAUR protein n=1 Tax=Melia azedarach TaxID=155640 RepID=A0ACC1Z1I3_MELAZ|nr:Auxin responsive SAUR protein [Melia azedarach]